MEIRDKIKARRLELGLTLEQVGDYVGVSKSTVRKWESGYISNMRRDKIAKLAEVLQLSPLDIAIDEDSNNFAQNAAVPPGFQPLPRMVKKPLIGSIACGEPILAEQNVEDYVDVPENVHCDFVLNCNGDSMIDAGISDGDQVYIRIQPEVENGEIAAVRIGDEATLKRVYWDGTSLMLMPANTKYAPKTYTGEQLNEIQIEGKAVGFTHWF